MGHVHELIMLLIVPHTVFCRQLPSPINLIMDSCHFVHLLTWQAGPGAPEGLRYYVKICTIGTAWKTVDRCAMIHYPLSCNLTDVFTDPRETYYINVTAFLGNETSIPSSYKPFKPVKDTVPESPLLRVLPCNESLCVYLQSPSVNLQSIYENFHYRLNVKSERTVEFLVDTRGLDTVVLRHLALGQQYCVSISGTVCLFANSAKNPLVCASTSAAKSNSDAVISSILCLLVLMLAVIGGLLVASGFVCLKTHLPSVLSSFQRPYKVLLLVWSNMEFQTHLLLEPNILKHVQVDEDRDEEMDHEKENEEVAYERRICCDKISEEAISSYPTTNPEIQYVTESNSLIETHTPVPQNLLKDLGLAPPHTMVQQWQLKPSETLSLFTNLLKMKHLGTDKHTERHEEKQEVQMEDDVNVNLFSLVLGGVGEQQKDIKQKEEMESMQNVEHVEVVPLNFRRPARTTVDSPHAFSQAINSYISGSEEDEEDYSGYMKRN